MAHIEPFRALRYDPARVALPSVVTQPYDKITPEMQDRYYASSPYNLVRIILGKQQTEDHPGENTYTRAAEFFRDWRRQGIFLQDTQPSVYVYSQRFAIPGGNREAERRGFIALGRLEDYSARVVFRHEQTLAKPKADRLDLLRATRAHYEQLFLLYEDSGEVDALLATPNEPTIEVTDEYGVVHRVWQFSDSHLLNAVRDKMADKKLVIADGHHRYETALNFRNECRQKSGANDPEAPYEFAMMTFVNVNDPGLLVLPTHRVVNSLRSFSFDEFKTGSGESFAVYEVVPGRESARATALLNARGRGGTALLAFTGDRALLLHSPKAAGSKYLNGLSERQRSLDVVLLHKCLLEGVLRLSEE